MLRTSLLATAALIGGVAIGAFALRPDLVSAQSVTAEKSEGDTNTYEQLNLFGEVFERIRSSYVEPVKDDALVESAINGMLSGLDPHSSYMNAKDYGDMQIQTKGEFGGLGIEVTMQDGLIKVVSPMDDTPAAKAGLQPNDLLSHIDGDPVLGLSLNQAVDKMRGEVGSSITLTVIRGNQDPFDVTMKRAVITLKSVRWEMEPNNIGYVRITSFSEQTDSGLKSAIAAIKTASKGNLAGLVLDLRNNPGGLLDQAIAVSDDFLDKGEIVSTRGRNPDDGQRWNAEGGDLLEGKPVIVLINGGSASASEIVAGALQDHHRAILMGTKSFGKGSVQSIIPIPNHGAIRLTTARYYTPSGRSIQAKGIDPDIQVEPAKIETVGDTGKHEADLRGALANPDVEKKAPDINSQPGNAQPGPDNQDPNAKPESENAPTNVQPGTNIDQTQQKPHVGSEKIAITDPQKDYQLARALDLLQGLSLVKNGGASPADYVGGRADALRPAASPMRQVEIDRESGRTGRWLLLAAFLVVGGAGTGLYFAGDRVSEQLHLWMASSGGGDLAAVPQPRSSAASNTTPPDLAEMPASVATGGAAPESWPELSPADLLAQSAALGDRSLNSGAFTLPPWRRYARPFTAPEGRPLLGLLVTGLGLDRAVTAAAIAGLPAEVSLSFSPSAPDLADWITAARAFGHEALVDLPLQSKDKRETGALELMIGFNADEAGRRIDAIADSAPSVLGFAGDGGDALLLDDTATAVMSAEIARLGLAFIDTSGEPMSQALPAAKTAELAVARSAVTLDARPTRTAITERLAAAVALAQEQGRALAVTGASPVAITVLVDWLRRQGDQGPVPAPASAMLQR